MINPLFARIDMGLSLAFHIIFASVGVTMPLLMVISEFLWRRTRDPEYLILTKAWAKGTAVFFAVGAVSGTVLSFELGLLFPHFMEKAGPLIGLPFALEGFAFFTEAIFLGIYLYGWEKVSPRLHLFAGFIVAASGAASAGFVTLVNAWMNSPQGFTWDGTQFTNLDPLHAMLSPSALHEIPHTLLASYLATLTAVVGIHAWILLRHPRSTLHRKAFRLALTVLVPAALLQPLVGHFAGQRVAKLQPMKLAAMEAQFKTEQGAPLRIGGLVDYESQSHALALEIPGGLSFIATNDFNGVVKGLEEIPKADWPSPIVHYCFEIMVATGSALALISIVFIYLIWRRKKIETVRWFLWAAVLVSPFGVIATETGWMVTEIGRQPWVIYQVLRTADAATSRPGILVSIVIFAAIYLGLGITTLLVLRRHVRKSIDPMGQVYGSH